jgi:hypothetical protein
MEAMMINNDLENNLAEKVSEHQGLVHRAEHLSIERELRVHFFKAINLSLL